MLKLRENNDKDKNSTIKTNKVNDFKIDCKTNEEKPEFPNSLGTNLKPKAPVGSNMLESFLKEVENTLIDQVLNISKKKISKLEKH